MQKQVFTGRVFRLSEFNWLDLNIWGGTSMAQVGVDGHNPGPIISVAPHPDDETGELWAEVQCKEEFDANTQAK